MAIADRGYGADESIFVAAGREHRQVLADLDAGGARRDRLELAADGVGRIGLEVEAVELREAAGEKDEDHGTGVASRDLLRRLGGAGLEGR